MRTIETVAASVRVVLGVLRHKIICREAALGLC
jgi:hypothetical protein